MMDEDALISFLEGLTTADFNRILLRLPGVEKQLSDATSHFDRVARLILYTRSTTGPGMLRLSNIVMTLFPVASPSVNSESIRQEPEKHPKYIRPRNRKTRVVVIPKPPILPVPRSEPGLSEPTVNVASAPTAKTNPIDGAEMVWIPAGEFLMGSADSDTDASDAEKPQRKVYLSGYWMYKYPVTVGQYEKFCEATGWTMPDAPSFNSGWSQKDHPMVWVSWEDAKAYCDWAGVSLPTEAQFEKAARGMEGWVYPWGNSYDDTKLWCSVTTKRVSTASVYRSENVCTSPYGCVDMTGNVWQECADWFEENYYETAPLRDPKGPDSGYLRVMRGASWDSYETRNFRSCDRGRSGPSDRSRSWGFRASSELA